MKTEYSAGGVIVNNGKVAMVKELKTQCWSLPKGHIDNNEDKLETAKREIFEETGLKNIEFKGELGSYTRPSKKGPGIQKNIHFFVFTTTENKLEPQDSDNPEAIWVDIEKVTEQMSYPDDKKFFEEKKKIILDLLI